VSDQISRDRNDARGKQLVEHIHVGRYTRHQAPDGMAVVEAHAHRLQVAENFMTQVEHDALSGVIHHLDLRGAKHETDHLHAKVNQNDPLQRRPAVCRQPGIDRRRSSGLRVEAVVDRNFGEIGTRDAEYRMQQEKADRGHDPAAVRPQIT
jgi:hypothetical protein